MRIRNLTIALIILLIGCESSKTVKEPMDGKNHENANQLIDETSPYLLQHAYNPVDWKAWNDESLEEAKKENKPILVSIGYSACHWCHVMERESFEDEEVAKIMNEGIAGVQFVHRYLAFIVIGLCFYIFSKGRKIAQEASQRSGLNFLLIAVILQFSLGVITLVYAVPISMGLLHQLGAFVLLGSTVFCLQRFKAIA